LVFTPKEIPERWLTSQRSSYSAASMFEFLNSWFGFKQQR
jgi:hypothetical protein